MILSDFLSIQKHDEINPHETIPISFNNQEILNARYYNINENDQNRYLIQTRSQAYPSGSILSKLNGVDKGVD